MDLVLDELGGEDETCGGMSDTGIGGRRQTWLGEGVRRVAVLHDKGERQKILRWKLSGVVRVVLIIPLGA